MNIKLMFARWIAAIPFYFKGKDRLIRLFFSEESQPIIEKPAKILGTSKRINVKSSNHIGWNVLVFGCYEKKLIKTMRNLLSKRKPRRIAIDVGANIGHYSLILSELFDAVYSFEPIESFRDQIKENIALNHIENVSILPMGLGRASKQDEMALLYDHEEPQTASVNTGKYSFEDPYAWKFEKTEIIAFDEFMEKKKLNGLDFMKIDTDGYEYDVLLGAEKSIDTYLPMIQIELRQVVNVWQEEGYVENAVNFLRKKGYVFLDDSGKKTDLELFNGDYYAIHEEEYHG